LIHFYKRKRSSSIVPFSSIHPENMTSSQEQDKNNNTDRKFTDLKRTIKHVSKNIVNSCQSSFFKQTLAMSALALGCLLDGTVIAYSSPALPSLYKKSSSIKIDIHEASWIGSVHTLGAVIGCFISIPTMSWLGRRGAALYVMSASYLLGYILIGFAQNVEMIIAGRLLGGIGLGLTLSITPVYLAETSSIHHRGVLGVIPPLFTQIGLLITYITGMWLNWSQLALTGATMVIPTVLFIWCIPESPVYLASKGKYVEAEDALNKLGREDDPAQFYKQVQGETKHYHGPDIYQDSSPEEKTQKSVAWRLYTHPSVWKPVVRCLGIMFFFQATGYNTIIAFCKLIYQQSGVNMNEQLGTGLTGSVILLSCVAALILAKIAKRKTLLLVSASGTSVNLAILGGFYFMKSSVDSGVWVPVICIIIFIIAFMLGYGAIAWTVMAEILPSSARGQLYPFAVAFSWVCNFAFAHSFNYIPEYIAFAIFSGLSFVGILFIIFCIPETKDKSAEQIAQYFHKENNNNSCESQA